MIGDYDIYRNIVSLSLQMIEQLKIIAKRN